MTVPAIRKAVKRKAVPAKILFGTKKGSLMQAFSICTTNGWVLDMAGTFYANQNGAEIIKNLIEFNLFNDWMKAKNFSLIVVFEMRKTKGFFVLMPALKGKRNQLTTKEANQSYFVTKIRLQMLGCILKLQHFCTINLERRWNQMPIFQKKL